MRTLLLTLTAAYAPVAMAQGASPDPRLPTVIYSPDVVVAVPVRRHEVVDITLAEDEEIVGVPAMGKGSDCADANHQWCVAVAANNRDILVKAKTGATTNNMIVITNQRRHVFDLAVVTAPRLPTVMHLSIALPPPPPRPVQPSLALGPKPLTAAELIENRMRAEPQVRNSHYSAAVGEKSEDIVPAAVFDDGTKTYLAFPGNRPLPVVFKTMPDGSEEQVLNVVMDERGEHLIVDLVARRLVLRLGGVMVVSIINEAFDIEGVPPKNGTTVPGVARVLRTSTLPQPAR